ncbi:hypothetical protein JTE90_014021 [Oedothorax gibbosus]|uniref:Reverse transcriptase domain-containing protein n=1 Tax=Oedothorax gibbosus TaxID=931172 RepID=A0AAV6UDF2_9ARAC|nr:hypothetical protein JTE90_014021 [Oedothorax gibbosus]
MSCYLPYEETVPLSAPARRFVDNCVQSGWKVIVSCDANAHHIIWGSKDCNNRGPLLTPPTGNRNPRKVDWDSYREELGCFLETLEKMVDRYIRDEVLPQKPLSKFQYAYQPGKSTETALYDLFTVLDRAVNQKELALATFLDIEGAFDRVPTEAIVDNQAANSLAFTS